MVSNDNYSYKSIFSGRGGGVVELHDSGYLCSSGRIQVYNALSCARVSDKLITFLNKHTHGSPFFSSPYITVMYNKFITIFLTYELMYATSYSLICMFWMGALYVFIFLYVQ